MLVPLLFVLTLLFASIPTLAQAGNSPPKTADNELLSTEQSAGQQDHAAAAAIPPGTAITMANWQQYKQYMPDGMIALFEGNYFWKMPPDVRMEVGPTIVHPLPPNYLAATEKYSDQVRVVDLPNGALGLSGYRGGIPFPNPSDPHKGWKILANLWYRYFPHIVIDSYGQGCYVDRFDNINCNAGLIIYRQLSFNTDPGVPATIPGGEGKYFTNYFETIVPEQDHYNANIRIIYTDPSHPEHAYIFKPDLRRYLPTATGARCSTQVGNDSTPDDFRGGYNAPPTQVRADFLGERKILNLKDFNMPAGGFPNGYDMPLGWPKPSWGKWQVRDVYVINVTRLPKFAAGYCYGKRIMYIDKSFYGALWEDLYDAQQRPWKFLALFRPARVAPGIGPIDESNSYAQAIWDTQRPHATFFCDPPGDRALYVNEQVPERYQDVMRYTTPTGLNMIMR
jgi:hypothetical protein